MTFSKLLTLSCINLGSEVFGLLFSDIISYSLYKSTFLSWMIPSHYFLLSRLVDYISFSFLSWYASWIWIWYICLSISLYMISYNLLAMLYISLLICFLCILLACNNVVSISTSLIFAIFASLIRFYTCNCKFAILSVKVESGRL